MLRTKLLIAITCALTASLTICSSAFSGGTGSETDPYKISVADDLYELSELSEANTLEGKYFVQTADIKLDGNAVSIAPNEEYPFMGNYNGMDYDISGSLSGLFAYTKDATVANVDFKDAVINISAVSGGIVSNASGNTVIESCSFEGELVLPSSALLGCNAGGIVGATDEGTTVKECVSNVTMTIDKSPLILYAGGIAGYNNGDISECTGIVNINAVSNNYIAGFGGIAGENCGEISGCEVMGSISGRITNDVALLYIGGIAGHNNGGKVERTVNKAALSAEGYNSYPGYIGGIAGYNQNGDISVSGNNGALGGSASFAGGVTGINYASGGTSTVTECLNIGEITVTAGISGGIVGGNLATEKSENVSTVSSSMNLYELSEGNGAVGLVQNDFKGVTVLKNLIVRNASDTNASTMTDNQLISSTGIAVLTSDAWVYPGDGFFPSLAVVKNLTKAEAIATAVDSENGKAAFTVYNPGNETNAVAVISFFKEGRFTGAKLVDINATKGYSVHTASTDLAKDADSAKVMVVNTVTEFAPITEAGSY